MNPDEMQELARAMEKVPGLKGIDHQDVRRLAKLLKENPEIGAIELKGFFGTGVVISRTVQGGPVAPPSYWPAPAAPSAPSCSWPRPTQVASCSTAS